MNGRNLFMVETETLEYFYAKLKATTEVQQIDWEITFNELIGINNIRISFITNEVYQVLGNVLSEILGIGCTATGMFNLNGFVLYLPVFATQNVGITPNSPLGKLYPITDNAQLSIELIRTSILIDSFAYWNVKFMFQECTKVYSTLSDYKTSALIGDFENIEVLSEATQSLVDALTDSDAKTLLTALFQSIAIDCNVGAPLILLFNDNVSVGSQ